MMAAVLGGAALPLFGLAAIVATVVVTASGAAAVHLLFYLAAVLPGIPVGLAVFGRHPIGWLAGAAFGYAWTALALWAGGALGATSAMGFALSWGLAAIVAWVVSVALGRPSVDLPAWRRADSQALLVVVVLALGIFLFPYKHLGAADAQGTKYYRAYFTADFVWHTALTAELARLERPPRNPYQADQPVHYYWTYFQLPAVVTAVGPRAFRDVEPVLKANAICTGVLMLAVVAAVTWTVVPNALAVLLAVVLAATGASAEGLYVLADLWAKGAPLSGLRDVNVDAISNWYFQGLRIDGIPRSMWYTPQHAMAVALGMLALPIAGRAGSAARLGGIWAAGLFLGASTLFNPLLGGMFSLIYGLAVTADALACPGGWRRVPRHVCAAVPVAAAVGWSALNLMFEGAGGAVEFGLRGFARNAPLLTLALSLGPLLVGAGAALIPPWRLPRSVWPFLAGAVVGCTVLYGVRLSVEESYVGFRGAQVMQATLPALAAVAFARGLAGRRTRLVTLAGAWALILVGLPTTVIDTYNAQDIGNLAMGPGFRWTIPVPAAEQEAFAWVRRATRSRAVVQPDPVPRARDTWTQLPTFGHRRMAAGLPISLINTPEYSQRSARVHHEIFATTDVSQAWRACRDMGIDYVYIGGVEREAHPAASLEKFRSAPQLFVEAFRNDEATIFAFVRP